MYKRQVDDIDGDAAEDKQFIVVKSKGGNYFYIIVDRAAEGENSVHFLNQVDESDLMAIIGEEQTEQPPAVCNCTEKCKADVYKRQGSYRPGLPQRTLSPRPRSALATAGRFAWGVSSARLASLKSLRRS